MYQISKKDTFMHIDVGQRSIIGTRKEQQDAVLIDFRNGSLLASICDGMGGMDGGRQASIRAIDTLKILHMAKSLTEKYPDFFLRAVDILDESVYSLRHSQNSKLISGTTIVSAAISENQLFWLSVGDSRLYIIRGEEIVCATTDHNYNLILDKAHRSGEISEAEYVKEAKKRDALISYIGIGGIDMMDRNSEPFTLQPDDVVLLTSDGLYRCLTTEDIFELVKQAGSAQDIAVRLIDESQAHANGDQDNTSVVVIKVNRGEKT